MRKTALQHFGRDFDFPNAIQGLLAKLSDVEGLEIGSFQTNDGVSLSYWKAGKGTPLVFIPEWSSNGAEYINLIHLLKEDYEVYVVSKKIARPTLVVSGEYSNWVESQRWIAETVPDGQMIVYSKNENGDHFLHLKEPLKFSEQLKTFLQK
ncbi:alpha/beta fold hydrolase [Pectobacterium peruviense]|uniref:Alpha/beta hydrolase n=1 Tax=Pectobacterium peruviense TaxID=2066479 RepID=A0ABX4S2X7_9GAMM|nr:alpha/beta hydrolase [Pectobacterium peruviense]KML68301.1 hypothetical protein G033_07535 [Pectobacterium peruviense]PKX81276.1 hypothetical protein A0G02_06950 [Pectobacterium peruviense]PKX84796.1 hypothetical protein A0G03_18850 [Pectobacterium peruviense]